MDIQIENMNEFEGRSNTYLSNTFKYLITVLSMIFAFFLSIGEGQAFFCGGGAHDTLGIRYVTQEYETQENETQEYEHQVECNGEVSCKNIALEQVVSNLEARFSSIPHIGISESNEFSYAAIGEYQKAFLAHSYVEMNYKSNLFPLREFKFRISLTTEYSPTITDANIKKSLIAPYLGTDQEIRVRELVQMLILSAYTPPSKEPGSQLIDAIATLIKPTDHKILEWYAEKYSFLHGDYLKLLEGANPEDLVHRPLLQSEIKLFTMVHEMGKTKEMRIVDSVIACDSELDTLKVDLQKLIGTITLKEYTQKLNTHGNSKLVDKKSEMKLNLQTAQACQKKLNEYSEYIANTDRNQVAKDSANAAKLESIKATSSKGMAN